MIGDLLFNRDDMKKHIDDFLLLYEQRPIKNNIHGMRINHMLVYILY